MSATGADGPCAIYSTEQVRSFDRRAIDEFGIAGFELMRRAAAAALECLRAEWPDARRLTIHCGAGNNAGDGYLLAALARAAGLEPRVVAVVDPDRLTGDAARARDAATQAGVAMTRSDSGTLDDPAVVQIDALLGTGLVRDVAGPLAAAVGALNGAAGPVLALDVPTGLDSDTGAVRGCAVRADVTISFVGLKAGLYLGEGPALRGRLVFADLGLPAEVFAGALPVLRLSLPASLEALFEPRSRLSHKGLNGSVLIVGGGTGMAGAARLAAEAALRVGAGLVHAAVAPDSVAAVMAGRPEIMCRGIAGADEIADWIETADVVVVGPGLGRTAWAEGLAARLLAVDRPLVVDADALNFLASHPERRARWVLTPHPGEAARLLSRPTTAIGQDRLGAVTALAGRYGGIAVLKGACSLVAAERGGLAAPGAPAASADCPAVCDFGNPGMATAGMGDVLSGVIGGLVAQFGLSARTVEAGVLVHALAGDDAAGEGERGLVASDLFPWLRRRVNPS